MRDGEEVVDRRLRCSQETVEARAQKVVVREWNV